MTAPFWSLAFAPWLVLVGACNGTTARDAMVSMDAAMTPNEDGATDEPIIASDVSVPSDEGAYLEVDCGAEIAHATETRTHPTTPRGCK